MRTIYLLITICLFCLPAYAQYSGGTGEPNDPYQIATAEDLMLLGETPEDYDKHFVLTADIDLDPNLPGRKVFDKAVIAPDIDSLDQWDHFLGTPFTGVFDGNGHTISHMTIIGVDYLGLFGRVDYTANVSNLGMEAVEINGTGDYVGGLVSSNNGSITSSHCTGAISGTSWVGGLVGMNGDNDQGTGAIIQSYSTGSVHGRWFVGGLVGGSGVECGIVTSYSTGSVSGIKPVGGLVGINLGPIANSYSTGSTSGTTNVGGLVGANGGPITNSYSTGSVSGTDHVGGLVGSGQPSSITTSFWDTQTSGQSGSAGGAGLTTTEIMDTYMLGMNGFANDPNWVLDAGRDYPRLVWQGTPGDVIVEAEIDWLDGEGTPDRPYRIDTSDQLILLGKASILWNKYFVLGADIDLDPTLSGRWIFGQAVIPVFSGVFDGGNRVISNLIIRGDSCMGLFGYLTVEAEVRNVGVVDANITSSGLYVGGLVGYNAGSIATSYISGSVSGTNDVGGLVGRNDCIIANCYSSGTFNGTGNVGGLVGENNGSIANNYSSGSVSGAGDVGGLVGENNGSISASYSTGSASGKDNVGGLVGNNERSIFASYSTGSVSGNSSVGGLVGMNDGLIANSYNTGTVSGEWSVGGLVGYEWDHGTTISSFWDEETSGIRGSDGGVGLNTVKMQNIETFLRADWDFVEEDANGTCDYWQISPGDYPRLRYQDGNGPLMTEGFGTAEQPYLIRDARDLGTVWLEPTAHYRLENSIDLSDITWSTAVIPCFGGSFDGNSHTISNLYIQGGSHLGLIGYLNSTASVLNLGLEAVRVNGTGYSVGGLVGENMGNISTNYCRVIVRGEQDVGGLVGYNGGSIATSYIIGSVSGDWSVGGLVGENEGNISASYSRGLVIGKKDIGGLVGKNNGSIDNSYTVSSVSGDKSIGGLVGENEGSISASFWENLGPAKSQDSTDLSTTEMQDPNTFIAVGWDFGGQPDKTYGIWVEPEDGGYPILWWQLVFDYVLPSFSGGNGVPGDPYLIATPEELVSIGHDHRLMMFRFKLIENIDLQDLNFYPIGSPNYPYRGVFDGNGHVISHLKIEGENYLGFFGFLGDEAFVKDLGVADVNIISSDPFGQCVGGLAGRNDGSIITSYSTGTVTGGGWHSGGLVGENKGSIANSYSTSTVTGNKNVGGLVSYNGGTISESYSTGTVTGNERIGGLVGYSRSRISASYSSSSVFGLSSVGGLVGCNGYNITTSYSIGTVTGNENVGGLVGLNDWGDITNSYSSGSVSGTDNVGGLVGFGDSWNVTNCFWDTQTSGKLSSEGGTGKTTDKMQTAGTFLEAGWDFVDENENGTDDIWWILEGQDYPRLWWEAHH